MDIDINVNINITVNGKTIPIDIEGINIETKKLDSLPSKENLWGVIQAYQNSLKKDKELV